MKPGRKELLLVLLLLAGGCRTLLLESLVFFPDRNVPDPPPGAAERTFTASDGVRVHAWYGHAGDEAPTLLWSHGNGGNIAGRVSVLEAFVDRGVNVLAYDYRGYGRSEGRPSEAGVYRDALAAWDFLRDGGVPLSRIVCFGESLGGAVSIRLASERPCAAVIVVSSFPSLGAVGRVHYGPLASLAGKAFDAGSRVADLGVPVLVAHGDRDDIVPFRLGEELFARATEPKRFLRLPGFGHNDVFGAPGLLDAIAAFAREASASAQ